MKRRLNPFFLRRIEMFPWPNLLCCIAWICVSAFCFYWAWQTRSVFTMNDYGSGAASFARFAWFGLAFGPPVVAIVSLFGGEQVVNANLFTLAVMSPFILGTLCWVAWLAVWNAMFTCKVKSFQDFVAILKKAGHGVTIQPCRSVSGFSNPLGTGEVIGDFSYGLRFTSRTRYGRKLIYEEWLFNRFGSNQSVVDAQERSTITMKLLLAGEQKLKELQDAVSGISVTLNRENGQPMASCEV